MSVLELPSSTDPLLKPRVLLWSLRNIQNFVYNACLFEFEDVIAAVDSAHFVAAPHFSPKERVLNKLFRTSTQWFKPARNLSPYSQSVELEQDYDVFFVVLDFPKSIQSINSIKNRRQRCRYSVCYIMEIWKSDLPALKNYLEFFKDFDAIFLGHANIVDEVAEITQKPCFYLPPAVDTLKFYPDLDQPREIDVCNLGRRSSVTHQALLRMAEQRNDFTYYYDRSKKSSFRCDDFHEHRPKTAKILKNSRYFFVNYSKFDQPEKIGTQREFGYRFFEGAAAGNIMIGCPPNSAKFLENFDWDDAVIPINFDEPTICELINNLDQDQHYLKNIQVKNVVHSLQRHDWVHRWQHILNYLGLPSSLAMNTRIKKLNNLAQKCQTPSKVIL